MRKLEAGCPKIDKGYAYYRQLGYELPRIGSIFTEAYRDWAWETRSKKKFPEEYFSEKYPPTIFIKHAISEILKGLGPQKGSYGSASLDAEIKALQEINPHAIITTNYDEVLEPLFPDYERVIGQQIIRKPYLSIGEIFKIHGCVSDPLSIIFTDDDYKKFDTDKKYLSAKLLTYFAEHPLLFIGYSAEDTNIKSILHDVDKMIPADIGLIPNIYILEWNETITEKSYPARDKVISVGEDRNIRVKSIVSDSFEWVFKAFRTDGTIEKINMKLLRTVMARTVDLIRRDAPRKSVEVDFQTLEHAVENGATFAKLFGITSLDDPSMVNARYPYTLTAVAKNLGFTNWNPAHALIQKIKDDCGFDMKESDNSYHFKLKTGMAETNVVHKYSDAAVDLLKKVISGEPYQLEKKVPSLAAKKM